MSAESIGDEGAGDGNGVGWEMREMRELSLRVMKRETTVRQNKRIKKYIYIVTCIILIGG